MRGGSARRGGFIIVAEIGPGASMNDTWRSILDDMNAGTGSCAEHECEYWEADR